MWNSFEWDINTHDEDGAHIFDIPQTFKIKRSTKRRTATAWDVFSDIKFPLQSWWLSSRYPRLLCCCFGCLCSFDSRLQSSLRFLRSFDHKIPKACMVTAPQQLDSTVSFEHKREPHSTLSRLEKLPSNYQLEQIALYTSTRVEAAWNRRIVIVLSFHLPLSLMEQWRFIEQQQIGLLRMEM